MKLLTILLAVSTQVHAFSPQLETLQHKFEQASLKTRLNPTVVSMPSFEAAMLEVPAAAEPTTLEPAPADNLAKETYQNCGFFLGFLRVITLGGGQFFPASWAFVWIPFIPLTLIPAVINGAVTASRKECGTTEW